MLETHLTSLEMSKKLKGFGIKQESEFYWIKECGKFTIRPYHSALSSLVYPQDLSECYSAFLSSELGEMFRKVDNIGDKWDDYNKKYIKHRTKYLLHYFWNAERMGTFAIYLLENGLIK
jgi:hypothetical protein